MGPIFDYLKKNTTLKDAEIESVTSKFFYEELNVGDFYIEAGKAVSKVGFIMKGVLKALDYDEDGSPIIHYFLQKNQFFSEADGLFKKELAKLSIQAAVPCMILSITIVDLEKLLKENSRIRLTFHEISQMELIDMFYAEEISRKGNAKYKYQHFLKKYPNLTGRIKDKEIASYLGISPYTLSHVKKEGFV